MQHAEVGSHRGVNGHSASPGKSLIQRAAEALDAGDLNAAAAMAREATSVAPNNHVAWSLLAVSLHRLGGNAIAALEAINKAVEVEPNAPEAWANRGAMLRQMGRIDEAEQSYRRSLAINPVFQQALGNLANLMRDQGRVLEAEQLYRKIVEQGKPTVETWQGLAAALSRQGRNDDAALALEKACALAPARADLMCDLAMNMAARGDNQSAGRLLMEAMKVDPKSDLPPGNLGALQLRAGQVIAAEASTRRAMELAPKEARWISNLGVTQKDLGRFDEAEKLYRRAFELKPKYALGHANLLFCLNYHPDRTAEEIFAEYKAFDAVHAKPNMPASVSYAIVPDPKRRLKVGYLSPDFREHAARHFLEPLLRLYDKQKIELFCYAEVQQPDHVTAEMKTLVDHWRSTCGLTDGELADLIRRDGIDVLVDFGGHTASSRLLVMAQRPAPIQIEHYLGHGYTSGLSCVDYFLSDTEMAPPGSEHLFAERVARLPRIPLAYIPPEGMPEPTPLPSLTFGRPVTFGYFGRTERLNDRVVKAWSEILKRVPGSRLVLNSRPYADAEYAEFMAARFVRNGVDRARIELVYTAPQPKTWEAYRDIDIALDPFPHNAGTTTIEALWLGIPVISVKDRPSVGRFGASILGALGLKDLVAETVDGYIDLAVSRASNLEDLAKLRSGLRRRFTDSPLYDGAGFALSMEMAYRAMWRDWCKSQGADVTEDNRAVLLEAEGGNAYAQGNPAAAAIAFAKQASIDPTASAFTNLGVALRAAGKLAEAEGAYRRAISLNSNYVQAYVNYGNLLTSQERNAEAAEAYARAFKLKPQDASISRNLGLAHMRLLNATKADIYLRRSLAIDPSDGDTHDNLAQLVRQMGRLLEAKRIYDNAQPLLEQNWRALGNMALLYSDLGRFEEAEALFRRALALKPNYTIANANLLFCVNYHPERSAEDIYKDYVRFDEVQGRPFVPANVSYGNDFNPHRRLRVGYMSPDFRDHAARHFLEPLLRNFDRKTIDLVCYAEVANPDDVTERMKSYATEWRSTAGMSDDALVAMIRNDKIDVLVDFGGHTSASRLLVMTRRPAPVQIEHPLGHGYTSGLSCVDAFLSDAEMAPAGSDHLFAERVVRMPRIPLAYQPPEGMPDVSPLPSIARKGPVTFGYFGRTERLNDHVIDAWAAILKRLPGSRLVLNSRPYTEPEFRDLMAERFSKRGVSRDRIELVFTTPQVKTWEAYAGIDIALDPFPHNAGTTTIEALWLGVPIVSLKGRPSVGCFGASILGAVGMSEWVAKDEASYIETAVAFAGDKKKLAKIRAGLRKRFATSPLGDGKSLARSLEEVYRTLWIGACGKFGGKAPGASVALPGSANGEDTLQAAFAAYHKKEYQAVVDITTRLIHRHPNEVEAIHLRGVCQYRLGRGQEAIDDIKLAIERAPDRADMHWNITAMLRKHGRLMEAVQFGREAVRLAPESPEAHNNLASVYKDLSRVGEAEFHFRRAIELKPDYSDAWTNLAWTLSLAGNAREGEDAARRAIEINPKDANAFNNLGTALMQQDRLSEAGQCFEEAVRINPEFAVAHSNALFCLNYRRDLTPEAAIEAYRGWDRQHGLALRPKNPVYHGTKDPNRRLRIGYVSPDFRYHAVSFFVEGILAAHDPDQVEVTCYAEVPNPDHVTERFRRASHRWRSTVGMSDEALAEKIREDEIDVLIDLAGHTGNNRLLTFARKPAPVQVGHMVGSGTTTGLSSIDAMLIDGRLLPEGYDSCFTERPMRLSRMPLFYTAPPGMPEVGPLPALRNGYVTFGCFSRPARINDDVIATWCRILKSVPRSRLVLNSKPFREAQSHAIWHSRFARHGIEPARVDLIFTSPQPRTWDAYGDIDVALDPFPHNAGTTTIEALWLGVPVVSLLGRPPVGRFGSAILGSLGMSDWVATDVDAYVARAVQATVNVRELAMLRVCLRDRFKASPLASDARGLAREIEDAYRTLWREYCSRKS